MEKEHKGVIILGTDTEVGKTFQAAMLARHLLRQGYRVGVYKPVASGISPGVPSDPELLHVAAELDCPLSRVCPQQFAAACAPPIAARLESKTVDEGLLVDGAEWWFARCDFLVVEGVGGALSPISDSMKVLDLSVLLDLPNILIAANRLGVVNHTLLTLEAIAARGLRNLGVVLNAIPDQKHAAERPDASVETNFELLAKFVPDVPIVTSITELRLPEGPLPLDTSRPPPLRGAR